MEENEKGFDDRLEREILSHLLKYVGQYDRIPKDARGGLDLLEYRVDNRDAKSNHIIDRDLLADYLSLKVAKSNNSLQRWVAFFALATTVLAAIQVLKILN